MLSATRKCVVDEEIRTVLLSDLILNPISCPPAPELNSSAHSVIMVSTRCVVVRESSGFDALLPIAQLVLRQALHFRPASSQNRSVRHAFLAAEHLAGRGQSL